MDNDFVIVREHSFFWLFVAVVFLMLALTGKLAFAGFDHDYVADLFSQYGM